MKDTPLYDILGKDIIGVNSYHHQAIKTLGEGLKVSAISEDNLIEGIYMPQKKFNYKKDINSTKLIKEFIKKSR